MKKIIFAALSLVTLFAFASCNKDYTCSCTFPTNTAKNFDVALKSMRHNDAKTVCLDYSLFVDSTSATPGSCQLK